MVYTKLQFLKKWYMLGIFLPIILLIILLLIQFCSLYFFNRLIFYIPATDYEVNVSTAINCSPMQTNTTPISGGMYVNGIPIAPPAYDYKSSVQCFMNAYKTCKNAYITSPSIPDTGSGTLITENILGKCLIKIVTTPGFIQNIPTTKNYCANMYERDNQLHISLCTNLSTIDYPYQ